MATARLTYDGNDIDFDYYVSVYRPKPNQDRKQNRSSTGQIEQINMHGFEELSVMATYLKATHKALYAAWWGWMREGKQFSFTLDSTKTAYAMLDDDADSGQKVIPLGSTTGISVGDEMIISNPGDNEREYIEVASIVTDVSITAVDNLIFDYVSAGRLKHCDYYPGLVSVDSSYVWEEDNGYFKARFKWSEALEVASAILEDTDSAILE